jgi:outer membrane protein assembly factor BamE (lipoprotein component of BamABCDE complex)
MSMTLRLPVFIAALAVAALAPSCLIGSSSHTKVSGRDFGPDTLNQVQPGKSKSYVIALLGDPTDKIQVDGGTDIWKWRYTEHRDSSGSVIFLVSSDSETETRHTTYVEFNNGAVVKAWRD